MLQGFYGFMDELRIWRTVRTQDDILKHMRCEHDNFDWLEGIVLTKHFTSWLPCMAIFLASLQFVMLPVKLFR